MSLPKYCAMIDILEFCRSDSMSYIFKFDEIYDFKYEIVCPIRKI